MFRTEVVSLDGFAPVLAQFDDSFRWNGFLCPSLDAHSVIAVLDAINRDAGTPHYRYDWTDEGVLVLISDEETERIEPDSDGLYALGSDGWIWTEDD